MTDKKQEPPLYLDMGFAEALERFAQTDKKEADELAERGRAIIRERNEPVSRTDLFKALTERGLTIAGTDPEMVLSTMLWRTRDRVARVKGGGYWLADVPNEAAGYFPETSTDNDQMENTPPEEELPTDAGTPAVRHDLLDEA
ncbi:hypothetical protein [Mesorhizobium sp. M0698]|uniref:hypothetical protein n=1 Tax=Mesorhizobium sp. M0698 TaxID=2956987 RepID=UPI0033351960